MSVIDRIRARPARSALLAAALLASPFVGAGAASYASSIGIVGASDTKVAALLKERLPKTQVSGLDCGKVAGLCEVTAGNNLFYVDRSARYLVIGRVYDMDTRQDLTAARLLEINPDMLVGGAAKANAAAEAGGPPSPPGAAPARAPAPSIKTLPISTLPATGGIEWGPRGGKSVTVFSDFQCGYCRALTNTMRSMNVHVIERPISTLGSRDLANRVYCAKNREQALHAAYAGEPVKGDASCDTSGLDANEAFARKHGLTGTPVIVRADGAAIEGYRPKEFLAAWLAGKPS